MSVKMTSLSLRITYWYVVEIVLVVEQDEFKKGHIQKESHNRKLVSILFIILKITSMAYGQSKHIKYI